MPHGCYLRSPTVPLSLCDARVVPARTRSASCSWGVQCDGSFWTSPSGLYQNGWPGYSYGGRNTLTLATSYYPRLGGVSLFLTYYQNGSTSRCFASTPTPTPTPTPILVPIMCVLTRTQTRTRRGPKRVDRSRPRVNLKPFLLHTHRSSELEKQGINRVVRDCQASRVWVCNGLR